MKHFQILLFLSFFLFLNPTNAQEFKFAFITDVHIGASTSEEDLKRTIEDLNGLPDIAFALVTGDVTEMGTDEEIARAKELLEQLNIPYHILPGNHDTGWSESGGVSFIKEFGDDKFVFEHEGYKFIGCASGPYVRMSDGHIPRDAIVWLDKVLAETPKEQPIIFINHYPLDNSLDNWYEATDRLKHYNTQFAICGHGHRNREMDFEGIPGTMGRSNLRAGNEVGGYNIVEITGDKAVFSERNPGVGTQEAWRSIPLGIKEYDLSEIFERPTYAVNDSFPKVEKLWEWHSDANVISTPVYQKDLVIYGNSTGTIEALSAETGELQWEFKTGGGVFSSPAAFEELVVFGSGDGSVYALNSETGNPVWKIPTEASVLGSPLISEGKIYIGGSDGYFRALDARTGKEIWNYKGLQGPVVSTPIIHKGNVIFGAWDKHLYALNISNGKLSWKWDNGSPNRMFSPAMVIPVAHEGVIYIAAPDRYLTAIDAEKGFTLWRTNEATVRESIGISEDNSLIYGKTMNDEIVAFKSNKEAPELAWRMDSGFGYDHVPSMLFEQDGEIIFGTRNGRVYSIDSVTKEINWIHKIDNSMVNTIRLIGQNKLIAATMDGKVALLKWEN